MGRLSPVSYKKIVQTGLFEIYYGGSESNLLCSLSSFGFDTYFVSKFPQNELGDAAIRSLKSHGVNTKYIIHGGDRLGLYFCEKGASQRPSNVIYDRKNSSFANSLPGEYDWENILSDADLFHFTGITPALSESCKQSCISACKTAKKLGVKISCDLNYRSALWNAEEAGTCMSELLKYTDILIANEFHCSTLFGIDITAPTDDEDFNARRKFCLKIAEFMSKKFNIASIGMTIRYSASADDNLLSGMFYNNGNVSYSDTYRLHIVDRIGGGDSFGAGLIYGILSGLDDKTAVEFAAAACALKHTIEGDINEVDVAEVEALMNKHSTGFVNR